MSEQSLNQEEQRKSRGRPKKIKTVEDKQQKPRGRPKIYQTTEEFQKAKVEYMKTYIREYYQNNKDKFYANYCFSDGTKPLGRPKGEIHKHVIDDTGPSPQVRCPYCNCVYTLSNHRHLNSMKCKYARLLKEKEL